MGLLGTLGGLAGTYFGGPSGGALGGLLGGALDGNTETNGGAGTTSKTPWAPSTPYLLDNLKTNADMQKFYQDNPFNAQQKTAFQITFSDLDNLRNNVAPGLMQFANNAMTQSYQRPSNSRPGMGGYSPQQQGQTPGAGLGNVFSMGQGQNFGQVDWAANNPFSPQNTPTPAAATATAPNMNDLFARLIAGNGGNYDFGSSGYNGSNVNDAFNSLQGMINTPAGAGAAYAASMLGLLGPMTQDPRNVSVSDLSSYGGSVGSNSDSDGSAGSTNPGGGGISGYGGGTY